MRIASRIQYIAVGNVFSETLACGNSKKELRQRLRGRK